LFPVNTQESIESTVMPREGNDKVRGPGSQRKRKGKKPMCGVLELL
jgi:hypothetical protein